MKKNRMMRLASILLVCVLLTTSVISGTFAKYTTQDSASDMARVAKWGVELQVVGNLYGDSYDDKIVLEGDTNVAVQSLNKADDVVAPGTKNDEGFTFSLKGQPEVDGVVETTMKIQNVFLAANTYGVMVPVDKIVTEANFDEFYEDANFEGLFKLDGNKYVKVTAYEDVDYYTLEDKAEVGGKYYPVVYTLAGSTATSGTIAADTLKIAADAIATRLGLTAGAAAADTSITYTGSKTFNSNDKLEDLKVDGLTLTWAWDFGDTSKGDTAAATDKADTILGLLENLTEGEVVKASGENYVEVVEYTDYCLDTQFSLDITVTQVD